jgi:putative endonuclease
MFYTYLLQSLKDKKWYTGYTDDLRKRFNLHNLGKVESTKNRKPFKLLYYEACLTKGDAMAREKYLKSGPGKRYLKNRLKRFLSLTGWTPLVFILILIGVAFSHDASAGTIIKAPSYLGLNNGLVRYWTFDAQDIHGSQATDRVGIQNATLTGTRPVTGKIGQGIELYRGDSSIDYGFLPLEYSIGTLSMWIYLTKTNVGATLNLFGGDDGICSSFGLFMEGLNPRIEEYDYTCFLSQAINSSINLNYQRWYHIVYASNASTGNKLYIDGIERGSNGSARFFANDVWHNFSHHTGIYDDVRVYNRALSVADVARLYKIGQGSKANSASGGDSLDKGLVGHWTFDGADIGSNGTIAKDRSGRGNNGTITGATSAMGRIGQALDFNGTSDNVDMGTTPNLAIGDDSYNKLSLSAWINLDSAAGNQVVFRKETDYGLTYYGPPTNTIAFGNMTQDGEDLFWDDLSVSWQPIIGRWYHVVGTCKIDAPNRKKLFIDGNLVAQGDGCYFSGVNVNGVLRAGSRSLNPFYYFNGKIDDVRIYNRTLSTDEIKRLYNQTQSKVNSSTSGSSIDKGLVGHWTFDGPDISGTRAKDSSGNNNHGTITGTTKVQGKLGQALSFNGTSDYIGMGNAGYIPAGTLTLSSWIYFDSDPLVNPPQVFIYRDGSYYFSYDGTGIWGQGDNKLIFAVIYDDGEGAINWDFSTSWLPQANRWYNLTVVRNRVLSTDYFYVDGVLIYQVSDGLDMIGCACEFNLARTTGGQSYFKGRMDDVRLYNRALSADEVKILYNSGR